MCHNNRMARILVLPFNSQQATLEVAGGKGLNLARLSRAGFPVPRGVIIPTDAYRAFVSANHLNSTIRSFVKDLSAEDAHGLEYASARICAAFSDRPLPDELAWPIRAAYESFKDVPVAVRSSATTEDLPDLSFAGQHNTYLNVIGEAEVLKAVVDCWSSLWTARAIGYRLRNDIAQEAAMLAVVIQEMIQSEVSGVLFTANPLTGLRAETVIDATFGLGESLVSGQVEPDHYVVNVAGGEIVQKTVGAKKISTRGKAGGGVETVPEITATRKALSDNEILQLAALGRRVQKEYGAAQDIEWAFADGRLYLLQARAITSLYPLPEESLDPLKIWFSFGTVQGLLGPMTPLGQDSIRLVLAGGGRMFGLDLQYDQLELFSVAGERIWVQIDGVMRNPIGARIYTALLPMLEPSVGQILKTLADDPRLGTGKGKLKFSTVRRLARFALSMLPRILHTMRSPEAARQDTYRSLDYFSRQARFSQEGDMFVRLADCVSFLRDRTVVRAFEVIIPRILPMLAPSMASLTLMTRLAGQKGTGDHGVAPLVLEVTRGLPHNVTTEMDLALWETARAIRADPNSMNRFRSALPADLAADYLNGTLPSAAQQAVAGFMGRYGMRGVGEIDIGNPRWSEQPEPIMQTLQSYLQITDENLAPDVMFERGARVAEAAIEKLAAQARRQRGGWLKEKLVRGAARRIRILMGIREAPKYYAIRVMDIARREILAIGRKFSAAGIIARPDDLFFLHISDLEALSKNQARDWQAMIAERRAAYEREARRRQVPRVLVSDGRSFYEGVGSATDTADLITGSPVSPGVAEGLVHVVFDLHQTHLAPGEILVCPGTDPAWTPLFMAAGGLITEVGGMMTHGSVVAREYGIPAVVGVHQATLRLKTGQRIRIDGTAGKILVIG